MEDGVAGGGRKHGCSRIVHRSLKRSVGVQAAMEHNTIELTWWKSEEVPGGGSE